MLDKLETYGWKTAMCYDFKKDKEAIDEYLSAADNGCLGELVLSKNRCTMPAPKRNKNVLKWRINLALELLPWWKNILRKKGIYHIGKTSVEALDELKKSILTQKSARLIYGLTS